MKDDKKNHKKIFLRVFDLVFSKIQDKKSLTVHVYFHQRERKEKKRLNQKNKKRKVLVVIITLHL